MKIKKRIIRYGNSLVVVIPADIIKTKKLKEKDFVLVDFDSFEKTK